MPSTRAPEPIIGVLGGMGPYAGLDLVKKIFDETDASSDQAHLPVALLSYPRHIRDRTEYMLDGGENPAYEIARIALELEKTGASVAGIPCNSAHAPPVFGVLKALLRERQSQLKLVSLIEETVRFIRLHHPEIRRIGILSTNSIYRLKVYAEPLEQAGILPLVLPYDEHDRLVHQSVYNPEHGIKTYGLPPHQTAIDHLHEAIERLAQEGAEAIILGCTELPLAISDAHVNGLPTIDPTRVLARALIAATYPESLKP